MLIKKICSTCKNSKILDEFYIDPKLKSGRSSACKECARKRKQERRKKPENRAKELQYSKEYESRLSTKNKRAKYRSSDARKDSSKRYYKSQKGLAKYREYRLLNIQKAQSREILNKAIANGKISKGDCEKLSRTCKGKVEGHHTSYKRCDALNVKWLCRKHHCELHASLII